MTDLSNGPTENTFTNVVINFTVYDSNGASDLNDSTAMINFTKTNEDLRQNLSCINYQSSGNYANFTCNVPMWWWDGSGSWDITAYIEDNSQNSIINDSSYFYVGLRTAFIVGPSILEWSGISPGGINKTSNNDALLLNNTGNDVIDIGNIEINSTNLLGETNPSYGLWSGNFSVDWQTGGESCIGAACLECAGTQMNLSSGNYVNIGVANLTKGNYTINDGYTGQEELYFCLRVIGSELADINQAYSTSNQGAWTIRILLVVVIPKRRKKKKIAKNDKLLGALNLIVDELKEEYSLNKKEIIQVIIEKLKEKYNLNKKEILTIIKSKENVKIPVTIFSKELGGLESIVKYMKENLNMNYNEIGKELKRDERTIWTAYKKAKEKQKEILKLKKTNILIPVSIFENEKLTILESIVFYLRKKEMKFSEIAKLLNRDQRNIWTIYSRADKKL
jgi:DNA-directed RNA polymerase specialized sigma24 family protein